MDINSENTDEINEQNIYKTLLINLENEFKDLIKVKKLAKRVANIQNASNKANIKFNHKFQKTLNSVIDMYTSSCEPFINNETSINEQISQLLNNISHKQSSIKRLATSANEYTEQLETIDTEEERAKQLLQLFNNETQLLTHLKPNFEKNVNFVKQQL